MLIPVLIISSLVHIYSISYMGCDPQTEITLGIRRFNYNKSAINLFRGKRYYSSSSSLGTDTTKIENKDFFEWFCGLTDGEGSFMLLKRRDSYAFKFQIRLHIDDIKALHYIQSTLMIGKVYIFGSAAQFVVTSSKDVAVIIDIFNRYPLNTTKLLNFLDFKKAYEIYTSSRLKSQDIIDQVEKIRSGMNSLRLDYSLPASYKVRVTPYWLLGFVEGEGSFCAARKNLTLIFNIGQSSKDLILMEAIRDFFNNLGSTILNGQCLDAAKLSHHGEDMVYLTINRLDYISKVLIPFFDNLIWQTKKNLDYQDWKIILKFRELGLQFTEEGLKVIDLILSQMNNNRLSTKKSSASKVDRALLDSNIKKLLEGPSNFEVKEDGRIFIKSLNKYYSARTKIELDLVDESGSVIRSFASMADCAKYLNVTSMTVSNRLQSGKAFLFDNKLVSLKKKTPENNNNNL